MFQPQSGPAPVAADPYQFGQLDFSPQAPEPEPYRPEPEPEPAPQADPYEFGQNLDFSPQAHDPEPEPETSPEDEYVFSGKFSFCIFCSCSFRFSRLPQRTLAGSWIQRGKVNCWSTRVFLVGLVLIFSGFLGCF